MQDTDIVGFIIYFFRKFIARYTGKMQENGHYVT